MLTCDTNELICLNSCGLSNYNYNYKNYSGMEDSALVESDKLWIYDPCTETL